MQYIRGKINTKRSGPLFIKPADDLPQDLAKPRSPVIRVWTSQSLRNLTGTSAAALPRCLSIFRAIWPLYHPISRLRDLAKFSGKTFYRLVNRSPGVFAVFFVRFDIISYPAIQPQCYLKYSTIAPVPVKQPIRSATLLSANPSQYNNAVPLL